MAVVFDPRDAAFLGNDAHLPRLSATAYSPDRLRARFADGDVAGWQPEFHRDARLWEASALRRAGVLVAVVERPVPTVLLTQRTEQLRHHPGQVAFPGGRMDASDPTPVATALREAHEEIGLPATAVEVLGRLPDYLTASAYVMTPVVGLVAPEALDGLSPSPDEVAAVFEVPLDFLMDPAHHWRCAWQAPGQALAHWLAMPYRASPEAPERWIWGATAAVLRNLYRCLSLS